MARYDSPGFAGAFPTGQAFDSHADALTAQGSDGIVSSATAGPVVGNPVVSVPFASSQLAESMPRVPVLSGDTSGWSDDTPAHASQITGGGSSAPYMETGAGAGHVSGMLNPNARS